MRFLLTTTFCCMVCSFFAFRNPSKAKPVYQNSNHNYNFDCAQANAQTDLDINNVRAKLLVGGDVWWNGNEGMYIVPKVAAGEPEVSSIFAGAIWMGGKDPAGNLKVAAQQYGTGAGNSDFWPGPLTNQGGTNKQTCENWDRFFSVTGLEVDLHLSQFQQSLDEGIPYDPALIPQGVKEWPAIGNEFFFEIFGFLLPSAEQGLAPFWDENQDGIYSPQFGDYPIIEIRGCPSPQYADEMIYWIFNDASNLHTETGADPLQMEIQALSFAFATDDAINDMTFNRYKLINRAQERIDSTFFAFWLDADLGCGEDDYVGCDTIRDLMYVYNKDAVDGSSGSTCTGNVPTYGETIPYLGIDFLRGPLAPKIIGANGELTNPNPTQPADTLIELGMTSFIYYYTSSSVENPLSTSPNSAQEYFDYLNGTWLTGVPITVGGFGFNGVETTKFVFHDEPNNDQGWSMCTANLPNLDVRTVQASGPFRLDPGQINELIIGVPWVPDVAYPCPDMGRLFEADDLAQSLFDQCFQIDMPTAISSPNQISELSVFPNPSKGVFTFRREQAGDTLLKILDVGGRVLQEQILQQGDTQISLDKYNSGVYYYVISQDQIIQLQGKLVLLD